LAHVDGDGHLLQELLKVFLDDAPREVAAIRAAVHARAAARLAEAAHTLKGAAAAVAATATVEAAQHLEDLRRAGELANAERVLARLEQAMTALQDELRAIFPEVCP
jgi:two-component system, sensor histidine kinase and response regulator